MKRLVELDVLRGFLLLMIVPSTTLLRRCAALPISRLDFFRPQRDLYSFQPF